MPWFTKSKQKRAHPCGRAPMQNNAKNGLEATTFEEVGKLKLVVAKVGQLGTTDVAGRSGLSRAGSRSGALRLPARSEEHTSELQSQR